MHKAEKDMWLNHNSILCLKNKESSLATFVGVAKSENGLVLAHAGTTTTTTNNNNTEDGIHSHSDKLTG